MAASLLGRPGPWALCHAAQASMGWLRRRLAEDPDYDWQAVLNHRANPPFRLWSGTEKELLREG